MRIHAITRSWNEEKILPYFLRHYCSFCDLVTVNLTTSNDKSEEIVKSFPNTRILWEKEDVGCNEEVLIKFLNEKYKEDRNYDWQIVCATDEILYHPNLLQKLEEYKKHGVTIPKTVGYNMIAEKFPTENKQIYEIVKYGFLDELYSKKIIFNPKNININYGPGAHQCIPTGTVKYSKDRELKVLHLSFLSYQYVVDKYKIKLQRRSEINKKMMWGTHYAERAFMTKDTFNKLLTSSIKVVH
jgi:hypothetical protein